MTKEDYAAIAAEIREARNDWKAPNVSREQYGINYIGSALSELFAERDGRFDRSRFLRACGVK